MRKAHFVLFSVRNTGVSNSSYDIAYFVETYFEIRAILMDDSSQTFVISSKFVNREYCIKFKVYMYI